MNLKVGQASRLPGERISASKASATLTGQARRLPYFVRRHGSGFKLQKKFG
jgi:hypothetical protein